MERRKIGILLPSCTKYPYMMEMGRAMEDNLSERGFEANIYDGNDDYERQYGVVERMLSDGCDALIVWSLHRNLLPDVLRDAKQGSDLKVVALVIPIDQPEAVDYYVGPDYREEGAKMMRHIVERIEQGSDGGSNAHQIELIGNGSPEGIDIIAGAQDALGGRWVCNESQFYSADDMNACMTQMLALMDSNRYRTSNESERLSGVICCDEIIAAGVIEALKQRGYVGSSGMPFVACFDAKEPLTLLNIAHGYLTAAKVEYKALGLRAAAVAAALLDEEGELPEPDFYFEGENGEIPAQGAETTVMDSDSDGLPELPQPPEPPIIPPEDDRILERIAIESPPSKLTYYEDESFDRSGMVVRAFFTDETSEIITSYRCYPSQTLQQSDMSIHVAYRKGGQEATAEQPVSVEKRTMQALEVDLLQNIYEEGEVLDRSKTKVTIVYDKGPVRKVADYEYYPKAFWGTGSKNVTITYSPELGLPLSQDVTITVVETALTETLSSIRITALPNKTGYLEGEVFDKAGMEVTASYDRPSDGSVLHKKIRSNRLVFSHDAMEFGQNESIAMGVSYTENGVTKSASFPVKRITDADSPTVRHANGASSMLTNLRSGAYMLETNDIAFGSGPMAVSFSHIYNSRMEEDFIYVTRSAEAKIIRTYMGSGHKLNLQQYLFPVEEGGSIQGDPIRYHYIDGAGRIHNIVENGGLLYDTSGLGLTLDTDWPYGYHGASGAAFRLTDRQGNMLFFDNFGRLQASRTAFGSAHTFRYDGISEKLLFVNTVSVSASANADIVRSTRTAKLVYSPSTGLLERIEYNETYDGTGQRTTNDNTIVGYAYESGKLTRIYCEKTEGGTTVTRTVAEFSYGRGDGYITEVKDAAGQVLRIQIRFDRVTRVTEGAYDSNESFVEKRHDAIQYSSVTTSAPNIFNQTLVTSDKGVAMRYNMGPDGGMYSIIEEIRTSSSEYDYAVSPQPDGYGIGQYFDTSKKTNRAGTELSHDSWVGESADDYQPWTADPAAKIITNRWINQKRAVTIPGGGENSYKRICTDIYQPTEMNREGGKVGIQSFVLSCWAKTMTNAPEGSELYIELSVHYKSGGSDTFTKHIDTGLKDWQLVCVPVRLQAKQVQSATVCIYNNNNAADLSVGDIRMVQGSMPEYTVSVGSRTHTLEKVGMVAIHKAENDIVKLACTEGMEFTPADAEQTRRNAYLAGSGNPFTVSLCGGRRCVAGARGISFHTSRAEAVSYRPDAVITALKTTQRSGLKDNVQIVSSTEYEPTRAVTTTTAYQRNDNGNYAAKDSETMAIGYHGLPLYRKDGYGVETVYTYDGFGNMTRMEMKGADGQSCCMDTAYEQNGEHPSRAWDTLTSGRGPVGNYASASWDSTFLRPSGLLSAAKRPNPDGTAAKNTVAEYRYDTLKQRPEYVGASDADHNRITYDGRGNIQSLVHNSGAFTFEYDQFGRVTSFHAHGEEVLRKEYTRNALSGEYKESTVYNNGYTQDEFLNEYGFCTKLTGGGANARMHYRDNTRGKANGLGSSAAQLREISDGFDRSNTTFGYNQNDQLNSVTTTFAADNLSLSVREEAFEPDSSGNLEVRSWQQTVSIKDGNSNKYVTTNKAWVDSSKLLAPKLKKTVSYLDNYTKTESTYDYDGLGRVKTLSQYVHMGSRREDNWETTSRTVSQISYFNNGINNGTSDFIEQHKIDLLDQASYAFDYAYYPGGQIREVTFGGTRGKKNVDRRTQTYRYDALGRLTTYSKKINYVNESETNIVYGSGGNVQSITIDGITKAFQYGENGGDRLMSFAGEAMAYDACGNPTTYRNKALTWTRGRLLGAYQNGAATFTYVYNKDGLRTGKETGNTVTKYLYDGGKLVTRREKTGNKKKYMNFLYDGAGLIGYYKDDELYKVVTDTFGTVHEVRDYANNLLASYSYDQWGKCTVHNPDGSVNNGASFIGNQLPIRWKGQYWDRDTKLYYIGGRWYDPETGRYINAGSMGQLFEGIGAVNGLNLYTFQGNDQINTVGNMVSMQSAYKLTKEVEVRHTKGDRNLLIGMTIFLAVLAVAGAVLGFVQAFAAIATLTVAGVTVGVLTILAATYIIADAVASVTEAFNCHGYNFMRDGLYGGNAQLHRMMAVMAAVVMTVGTIASANIARSAQLARAETALKQQRCFIAGTLVVCKNEAGEVSRKAIEEIAVGNEVWAFDEQTGVSDWKKVLQLFRNVTSAWICTEIEVDGKFEKITSTPGHMYYLPFNTAYRNPNAQLEHDSYEGLSEKWVSAEELKKDDKVLLSDGRYGIVKRIKRVHLSEPETTYNFEVEDLHTYYVGENGVCVHNAGAPCSGRTSPNQMQKQVERGKAPKGVERVDPAHPNPGSKPHTHFGDQYRALNWDGTWHDAGKKIPNLTNDIVDWLTINGWGLPK